MKLSKNSRIEITNYCIIMVSDDTDDGENRLPRKKGLFLHHSNVKLLFCILFLAGLFQVGSVSNLERDRKRKQLRSELSLARVICFY